MRQAILELKWHWFLSPLPTSFVYLGIWIVYPHIGDPDPFRMARLTPFLLFGPTVLFAAWYLLVYRRVGAAEGQPPVYFSIFWIIALLFESALIVVLAYLNIGGWRTFQSI